MHYMLTFPLHQRKPVKEREDAKDPEKPPSSSAPVIEVREEKPGEEMPEKPEKPEKPAEAKVTPTMQRELKAAQAKDNKEKKKN